MSASHRNGSLPRDQTSKASPSPVSVSKEGRRGPNFQRWIRAGGNHRCNRSWVDRQAHGSFQRLAGEALVGLGTAREERLRMYSPKTQTPSKQCHQLTCPGLKRGLGNLSRHMRAGVQPCITQLQQLSCTRGVANRARKDEQLPAPLPCSSAEPPAAREHAEGPPESQF